MFANWAYLPEHLLEDVLDRFVEVSDYVRFSVVCKRWLSTAQFHRNQWRLKSSSSPEKQIPLLLVQNRGSIKNQSLHSVVVGKDQILIKKAADLHMPDYMYKDTIIRFCGSSHGWLIFIRDDTFALILYNPFTKSAIDLPPILDVPKEDFTPTFEWFKMAVLSNDPSLFPDTYQVLVLYYWEFIWLFRSGSDSWVRVKKPQIPQNPDGPTDIYLLSSCFTPQAIYHRGKFYIAGRRSLITVETNDECCAPHATYRYLRFQQIPNVAWTWYEQYLLESCNGCLLYIERFYYDVKIFKMYEVNLNHEDGPMCSLLSSLGGETLFLGFNYSLSLFASESSGCQPNCIYYTDYRLVNIGVYDVRREHTKHLKPPWIVLELPTIWIFPQANLNTSRSLVAN